MFSGKWRLFLPFLLLLLAAGVINYRISHNNPDCTAPSGGDKQQACDLNRDGRPEYYALSGGILAVTEERRLIWRSPPEWQVDFFVLGDANNDGHDDLLMVVWKRGSFGRDKPFWLTGSDSQLSNHLFVYDLVGQKLKPVWMSSALDRPIQALQVQDINDDGMNELLVQEKGNLPLTLSRVLPGSAQTVMQWRGWGFYQLDVQPAPVQTPI